MKHGIAAVILALCVPFVAYAQSAPKTEPSQVELEFSHTKIIYFGYVGEREDQIANMLELTIGRMERNRKMLADSGVRHSALERDMADFEASLFTVRHMTRARDASRAGNETVVTSELATACRFATAATHYLDPRLEETCVRFEKYGYVRMT